MAALTVDETLPLVQTPTSPSSAFALSRFEFETGKGNEGTKVLMVEWDSSAGDANSAPDWEVSWEGKSKSVVLPVRDAPSATAAASSESDKDEARRVYFLLPPGAPVPALVTISQRDGGAVLRTKPMPAIFPAELSSGARDEGRRGVLHTLWARRRLAELEGEIAHEMQVNGEGIGLEMALQENLWIAEHFGVGPAGLSSPASAAAAGGGLLAGRGVAGVPATPVSPTTPRSPIGGKLGDKLRGLKLATSPEGLAAATQASRTSPRSTGPALRMFPAGAPSRHPDAGVASLDAIVGGGGGGGGAGGQQQPQQQQQDETEEELFALPMSPRSPEMAKSPFSLLR